MNPIPYKDFTLKAKLKDFDATELLIKNMPSEFIGTDYQTDYYFETSKGKLKLRKGTIENLITHYERVVEAGMERTVVYRYDINPREEQINDLANNYKKTGTTKKERKIYLVDNIKIHLDKLPNGDEFIEIETIDVDNKFSSEELKTQCLKIKYLLGIKDEELLSTGYFTD